MSVITILNAKERENKVKSILKRYHDNEINIDDTITKLNPYKFLPKVSAVRLDGEMIRFSSIALAKLGKSCKNSPQNVDIEGVSRTINFLFSWPSENVVKAIKNNLVDFSKSLLNGIENMSNVYVMMYHGKFFNKITQENVLKTKKFVDIVNSMPSDVKNTITFEYDKIGKSIALSESGTRELFYISDLFDLGPTSRNRTEILKHVREAKKAY